MVWLANLAWLVSCLPGWVAFAAATRCVRKTQTRLLLRILRANASTEFGRRHGFGAIRSAEEFKALPLTDYEDCVDDVNRVMRGTPTVMTGDVVEALLPTSGSTQATKLIPYTSTLGRQFRAAVDAWMGSLYFANPSLLGGRHYWSISPTTRCPDKVLDSLIPVGFGDDAEYLGQIQRRICGALFAVPAEVAQAADPRTFEYLTLLFLLREKNLRLISVWHPSFLTVLLQAIPFHMASIVRDVKRGSIGADIGISDDLRRTLNSRLGPDEVRAKEIMAVDLNQPDFPRRLWPTLRLISCWTEGRSDPWIAVLRRWFPDATIQGKGLAATEGIVSFPFGRDGRKVCAVRSHFLEFIEPDGGRVRNVWDLEEGRSYSVVLTTGGGLYRYRLHDVVRVTGFVNEAPCLDFLARDNLVSDLVGEKLNVGHVEACLRSVELELKVRFAFAMVAPVSEQDPPGYVLYVQLPPFMTMDLAAVGMSMEARLLDNYHYRHARRLGQLQPLRVSCIEGDATAAYRNVMMKKGLKAGDIKFAALSKDSCWGVVFGAAGAVKYCEQSASTECRVVRLPSFAPKDLGSAGDAMPSGEGQSKSSRR